MQRHDAVLVEDDLVASPERRDERGGADEQEGAAALRGLQAGEVTIAGLLGAELEAHQRRLDAAQDRLDGDLGVVDRAAGAVGEQQGLATGFQKVQRAGEGVLTAGDQRDAVVVGKRRLAHPRRAGRCGLALEVQPQLVAGQVRPDALDRGAVGCPESRVADRQPGLD